MSTPSQTPQIPSDDRRDATRGDAPIPEIIVETPEFSDHFRTTVHNFRGSLIEMLVLAGVQTTTPSGIARALRIDRTLAWKMSRVVNANEPFAAVRHVPGKAALEKALERAGRQGATREATDAVRRSFTAFERMVELHAGDRRSLEMTVQSMKPELLAERQETARQMAFQGTSAIWGVQARVRVAAFIVQPSATDSAMVDLTQISGVDRLRRLRPGTVFPLFRMVNYGDDGLARATVTEAIEPHAERGAPLLREFCSTPLPEIAVRERAVGGPDADVARERIYELLPGPVGKSAAVTCFTAQVNRCIAPAWRTGSDTHAEFATRIGMPLEHLVCDLFIHRELDFGVPAPVVVGCADGDPTLPLLQQRERMLPVTEGVEVLAGAPPVVATPLIPRYSSLIAHVMGRLDASLASFTGYRFAIRFPPMSTMVALACELPARSPV